MVIGLFLALGSALLVLDLTLLRKADRFDAIGDVTATESYVWAREKRPGLVRVAGWTSLGLGVIGFPATLAPVVLTVLAFQKHPVMSDGWVSLTAVVLAGISMSVAIKQVRVAHLLASLQREMVQLLRHTLLYLGGWIAVIWILLAGSDVPGGHVGLIVWTYLGVVTAGSVLVFVGVRAAITRAAPAAKGAA